MSTRRGSISELVPELKNEKEVIRRCQRAELAAFETVYRHYEQALLNIGLRMLRNQQDAEDAVQTTFMKLYHGIARFSFKSKFNTYLYRILMNVCFDMLNRRRHRAEQLSVNDEQVAYFDIDLKLHLEEAIDALPDRMRACFTLFAVQEMKQTEVAEILDMNIGTVKATIFQAKAKLRAFLSNQPELGK